MRVPYNTGLVVDLPLISQADTKLYKTSPTIAAGDAKLASDGLLLTTLTSKMRAFTSGGTYVLKPGDTITGHTSAATARVIGLRLTSGTFAGADAAGVLFLELDSGTFQSENLDVGSNLDVATIGGALSAAGVFSEIATGMVAIGIPASMLACRQASLIVRDAAGAEWCDTGMTFETEGHENAWDPQGCILTDTVNSGGQTTTNIRLSAAPTIAPKAGYYFEVVGGTGIRQAGYVKTYTAGATYDIVPNKALTTTLDSTSIVKFYINAPRVVADVESVAGTAQTAGDLQGALTAPTTILSATPTMPQVLAFLATLARNKITGDGSTMTLYADDGTTPICTWATSVGGATVTRAEGS